MTLLAVLCVATGLTACVSEPDGALLVPADVEVAWDESWNDVDDGVTALVPVDVMAYDDDSGDALSGAEIGLVVNWDDADLLDVDGIIGVDDACGWSCGDAWDAYGDRWYSGEQEFVSASVSRETDVDGLVRMTVRIDAFPTKDGVLLPVPVTVYGFGLDETFVVLPR